MDNIKKNELLELKTKLIKDIRNWKPSGGDAPDCFTMLHSYEEQVKKLTIPVVSVMLPIDYEDKKDGLMNALENSYLIDLKMTTASKVNETVEKSIDNWTKYVRGN